MHGLSACGTMCMCFPDKSLAIATHRTRSTSHGIERGAVAPEDVTQDGQHAEGASQAQSQHRVLGSQQVIMQLGQSQHRLRQSHHDPY